MSFKNLFRPLVRSIFGKSIEVIDLKIKFHKEANLHGTHGLLVASHKGMNLEHSQVRFVFVGVCQPPAMTPRIVDYIWEEALAQGFIPHSIASYGHVLAADQGVPARALVSEERRQAEVKSGPSKVDNVASLTPRTLPATTNPRSM